MLKFHMTLLDYFLVPKVYSLTGFSDEKSKMDDCH
jgi:hypothetical protein